MLSVSFSVQRFLRQRGPGLLLPKVIFALVITMSLWQSYRNLSPKARAGVGAGLLLWGFIGLQLSDKAGEKLGLQATEEDKARLEQLAPKIIVIDKK